MQFDAETPFAQAITGYGPDGITISGKRHAGSLLISSNGLLFPWRVQSARSQLEAGDLEAVVNEAVKILPKPYELVILGTGNLQFFPDNQWLAPFIARGLPLEIMSTPAACRTYNIVASEGRTVLAALWQGDNNKT
ncbi:MAG: hypothetical protein KBH08_01795 [Brachymonas sp.]|jgi:uncharacterized protein|nr:hypothetical protein [Brachymonas sp.]MBP8820815.1 hypothetical protein [Brachymonas sp.]